MGLGKLTKGDRRTLDDGGAGDQERDPRPRAVNVQNLMAASAGAGTAAASLLLPSLLLVLFTSGAPNAGRHFYQVFFVFFFWRFLL